MTKAKPADPNWLTFDEVRNDPNLGHSSATLNRFIRTGIPLLDGTLLANRKEYRRIDRGRWGEAVLKRLVVSRSQLAAERQRAAELGAKPGEGLLVDKACVTLGVSQATLVKLVRRGKVRRTLEEFLRTKAGPGKRYRYHVSTVEPLASTPTPTPPVKKFDEETYYSAAKAAQILGVSIQAIFAAKRKGKYLGVPFRGRSEKYGEKDVAFYFKADVVHKVRERKAKAKKKGWCGTGAPAGEHLPQFRTIAGLECENAQHVASRLGVALTTITALWSKPGRCRHVPSGKLTIKRYRSRSYVPSEEVSALERNWQTDLTNGYVGTGRPRAQAGFAVVAGEYCVSLREAARQLGLASQTIIRQWRDRRTAPGLDGPPRIISKARSWSFLPVDQFQAIAAAMNVAVDVPSQQAPQTVALQSGGNGDGKATAIAAKRKDPGGRPRLSADKIAQAERLEADWRASGCTLKEFPRARGEQARDVDRVLKSLRAWRSRTKPPVKSA